jgi:hypothetical protein
MASVSQAIVYAQNGAEITVTGLERMCRNCAYCCIGERWGGVTCVAVSGRECSRGM